jgi:predicted MFS family arabinose efflux permease
LTSSSPPEPSTTRTLLFLGAASFASAASLRACDPILPDIAASFSTTPGDAAKVVTVFGVGYALAGFSYGFIGDRFGKLRVIAATTLLSSVATIACALSSSLAMLTVARIVVALTAAAIIPLAFAWIGDVVPYERRQPVLGRFLSGQISGMVLGQVFAGAIAEHLGWRYVFVMIAALFVVAGVALSFELRRQPDKAPNLAAREEPVLTRFASMLREPWVAVVLATTFLEGMIFFGAYTFVGSYIYSRFRIGLDLVGLIVAGFGVGGLIYAAMTGRLVAALGERGLMLWGGVVVAISFVAITIAPVPAAVAPATVLAGLSYYMIHNTLQTHATQMAPAARGFAVSTFASALFLGQASGVAIAAPIFDYTGGKPIFLSAAVLLCLLCLLFRALLDRRS